MAASYAALYRHAREELEAEAEERLGRPLSERERNIFRSCGTLTALETLGMEIFYAASAAELAATLAATSMERRFQLAIEELLPRLERLVGRPLVAAERGRLHELGNIEALWELELRISALPPAERDRELRAALRA